MNFSDIIYVREQEVGGIDKWVWLKSDIECFNLIAADWPNHFLLLKNIVRSARVVIQAGGNLGMYPRLYSSLFETVYTFEPDPINFHCLTLNCSQENVIKLQMGLSDRPATAVIRRTINNANPGMNSAEQNENGRYLLASLDSFYFPFVDLIHLDTEGSEIKVLQGAKQTILAHKPTLLIENGNTEEVKSFLKEIGYKMVGQSGLDFAWVPQDN